MGGFKLPGGVRWSDLLLLLWALPHPGGTKRVELTASATFPAGGQVTGMGHHQPLPASLLEECVLRCAREEASCTYSGFHPGENLCYFFHYGLPPDPALDASALKYFMPQDSDLAVDCVDVQSRGSTTSGTYPVQILTGGPMVVWCDMDTDGGGWTVFQRRQDGSQDFDLPWASYAAGFGDPRGEHWLGNELLHALTGTGRPHRLRVELLAHDGTVTSAVYNEFSVSDRGDLYRLTVSQYQAQSTAADPFSAHSTFPFSTLDSDNDFYGWGSCSQQYGGGWWFTSCLTANLNGRYGDTGYALGLVWDDLNYSYKASTMMLR